MAYNTITELNSYMRNSNCEYFNNKYITTLFFRLMNINVLLCLDMKPLFCDSILSNKAIKTETFK